METAIVPGIADLLGAGVTHHQAGRLAEAEACYRQVLTVRPDHADALHLLGAIAQQVGRHDLAVDLIRQAIRGNGQNPFYFCNLGFALRDQGVVDEAVAACREAIRIKPDLAEAHSNLGLALRDQGKLDEAVTAYREAICIKPDLAEAHSNLGSVLKDQNKFDEAIAVCLQAIRIKPNYAEPHSNLGATLYKQGKLEEAARACREAIRIKPDLAEAHTTLGIALQDQGKLDEAAWACREAIRVKPDFAEAHTNLGCALQNEGKLVEALAAYREAIRIKPNLAEAYINLGSALQDQGKLDEAVAAYRQVLLLKPDFIQAGTAMLTCQNYDERVSNAQMFDAHRSWDERYARALPRPVAYANDRNVGRRLKVGYVSADFRQHSVAYFLEPLLRCHDRSAIEVFCYAEVNCPDAVTERFKGLADHWVVTIGMPDEQLADRIRLDSIDILMDVMGHTAKNRLLTFARKPAPVQVTWLGYPNTTGLKGIDYRLVDAVTDPDGESDAFASETLIRLPGGFLCYGGPKNAPVLRASPCLRSGIVTFGSFNNPTKLSAATLDVWARLLDRLPVARLLLKGKPFADAATRALYLDRLAERGVAPERVELVAWLPDQAHLALYDRVDIALDPFPYNGTTTTCEALWMGVPVVTLRGDRHASRVGASLLTPVGLSDLIAGSVEEYLEIAVALAGDPARLTTLRGSLRPRVAASELCDAPGFARKVEAAYRTMWRRWCAAQP